MAEIIFFFPIFFLSLVWVCVGYRAGVEKKSKKGSAPLSVTDSDLALYQFLETLLPCQEP